MSDNLKLLTKDYFNRYPVKEYSAARLEYSMLLMPEVMDVVDAKLPQMREMAAKRGIDIPDATELMAKVEQEEDTRKLLRMLRQTQPPVVRKAVREKLLNREEEVLPEIQRMILKAFNDNTIENCVRFMTKCGTNCSDWIMQNYNDVREPYARSMLCLVLGFRANTDAIPFLMQQVDSFVKQFPDKSYEQGPLMALYEIRARFRTI